MYNTHSCIIRNFKSALQNTLKYPLIHSGLLEFVAKRIKYQEIVLIDDKMCQQNLMVHWNKEKHFPKAK